MNKLRKNLIKDLRRFSELREDRVHTGFTPETRGQIEVFKETLNTEQLNMFIKVSNSVIEEEVSNYHLFYTQGGFDAFATLLYLFKRV